MINFVQRLSDSDTLDYEPSTINSPAPRSSLKPSWKLAMEKVSRATSEMKAKNVTFFKDKVREIIYVVDIERSLYEEGVFVFIMLRESKKDKTWGKPKAKRFSKEEVAFLPEKDDREILSIVEGATGFRSSGSCYYGPEYIDNFFIIPNTLHEKLLPLLCKTGRAWFRGSANDEPFKLHWDDTGPWKLRLIVEPQANKKEGYFLKGRFLREDKELNMNEPSLLAAGGVLFWEKKVSGAVWPMIWGLVKPSRFWPSFIF